MNPQDTVWYKRWQMELSPLPQFAEPGLALGFRWVAWSPELFGSLVETKFRSFVGELDAVVFPSTLGTREGCRGLLQAIVQHREFCPQATWLIARGNDWCGTVQGLVGGNRCGAIQNLGVTAKYRGFGLGTALLHRALCGFRRCGMRRAFLEVTADNAAAVALYRKWGFRCRGTVYKALHAHERVPLVGADVRSAS